MSLGSNLSFSHTHTHTPPKNYAHNTKIKPTCFKKNERAKITYVTHNVPSAF